MSDYTPKHEKIREKAILTRLVVFATVVVICLLSMGITAFAYFTCNISTNNNVIKAAKFETRVTINLNDANGADVMVNTSDYKSHWAKLDAGKTYYVTIKHTSKSQVGTGFAIVEIENGDAKYHTQQIAKDDNGTSETIAFYLKPNADTKVTFHSHWGTSSYYPGFKQSNAEEYIENGETVSITLPNVPGLNPANKQSKANVPLKSSKPKVETSKTEQNPQTDAKPTGVIEQKEEVSLDAEEVKVNEPKSEQETGLVDPANTENEEPISEQTQDISDPAEDVTTKNTTTDDIE